MASFGRSLGGIVYSEASTLATTPSPQRGVGVVVVAGDDRRYSCTSKFFPAGLQLSRNRAADLHILRIGYLKRAYVRRQFTVVII